MVSGDLVLEVTEESLLGLLSVSLLIDNPFFVFEELSVLFESFVDIGLAMDSSATVDVGRSMRVGVTFAMYVTGSMHVTSSVDVTFTVHMTSTM